MPEVENNTQHMNGSATLIPSEDDEIQTKTDSKALNKSKLLSDIKGMFVGRSKYLSWSEFVRV